MPPSDSRAASKVSVYTEAVRVPQHPWAPPALEGGREPLGATPWSATWSQIEAPKGGDFWRAKSKSLEDALPDAQNIDATELEGVLSKIFADTEQMVRKAHVGALSVVRNHVHNTVAAGLPGLVERVDEPQPPETITRYSQSSSSANPCKEHARVYNTKESSRLSTLGDLRQLGDVSIGRPWLLESKSATIEFNSELHREEVKAQVRASITKQSFNVQDLYKQTGVCQQIARSPLFEHLTLIIVGINTIWIGIETDINDADMILHADPGFIFAENLFCLLFSVEWMIRFLAFTRRVDCIKDYWFVFDSVLVFMMALETWLVPLIVILLSGEVAPLGGASAMRVVRLLRLARMARVAHVLRAMPELVIMVKALKAGTRSVAFTLVMLLVLLYVFGVTFCGLTKGHEAGDDFFSTVGHSMYSLLVFGVLSLDFVDDISRSLLEVNILAPVLFFLFVLLAALTVMNLLIGILCEVVTEVASGEKEEIQIQKAREVVAAVVQQLDVNDDDQISRDEFLRVLKDRNACKALNDIGIDVVGLIDLSGTMFYDSVVGKEVELPFHDLMKILLQLRPANTATVKDVLNLERLIHGVSENFDQKFMCAQQRVMPGPPSVSTPVLGA